MVEGGGGVKGGGWLNIIYWAVVLSVIRQQHHAIADFGWSFQ